MMHLNGRDPHLLHRRRLSHRFLRTLVARATGNEPPAETTKPLQANGSNAATPAPAVGPKKAANWWTKSTQDLTKRWQSATGEWAKATNKLKAPEFRTEKIDPAIRSARENCKDVWMKLPPRLRAAVPHVAFGLAVGVVVHKLSDRRVARQKAENDSLEQQVLLIKEDNKNLERRYSALQFDALSAPRTEMEDRMSESLDKAMSAAAHAAEAAATAATACAVRAKKSIAPSDYTAQWTSGAKK